ncbi:type I phosphomannose isomerase catalytic subunit [Deinococcus malanensis]|uniref:type I phosphomannose isomerase catalytic subunit n=1 Tax=Deinococcus malanensis TaxID=1706855 RepID=UPI003640D0CB
MPGTPTPDGDQGAGRPISLLIKLLDCQEWLSVQVHPDDAHARNLVGPGENGKTEAWYVLEAAPGAQLIGGVDPGVSPSTLREAILSQDVSSLLHHEPVVSGDTFLVCAGTVHALGPGLLIYEVQQTSDTTYRVFDWDRPASAGRELHLHESAQVAAPGLAERGQAVPQEAGVHLLTQCEYFTLEQLRTAGPSVQADTRGEYMHLLTAIEGEATLTTLADEMVLQPYDTVVIPASLGTYTLAGNAVVLRALPGAGKP